MLSFYAVHSKPRQDEYTYRLKADNCKNRNNRIAYFHVLTPRGIEENTLASLRFQQRKLKKYEALRSGIGELRIGVASSCKATQ